MNIKKFLATLSAFILAVGFSTVSFAQEEKTIEIYGNIAPKQTVSVFAPAGGVLEDNTLALGDRVEGGQVLFTLLTQKTFAPWEGTVRGLNIEAGQNIQTAIDRYGAALYIEPVEPFTVHSSTAQGYHEKENKIVLPGQKVYLLSTSDKDHSATGVITAVEGINFTVEVDREDNTLEINERTGIYRTDSHDSKSRLGYGITASTPLVPVVGSGIVVSIHVSEGQQVQKGDLLFETLAPGTNAPAPASSEVTAPLTGVVTAISAASGSAVAGDQLLVTIADDSQLQIIAAISENDYSLVNVNEPVTITFDAYPDLKPIHGIVESIAASGTAKNGENEYQLKIAFSSDETFPLGLEATVTLNP